MRSIVRATPSWDATVDLALIDQYDGLINDLEVTLVRDAKRHDADAFHRLRFHGL